MRRHLASSVTLVPSGVPPALKKILDFCVTDAMVDAIGPRSAYVECSSHINALDFPDVVDPTDVGCSPQST